MVYVLIGIVIVAVIASFSAYLGFAGEDRERRAEAEADRFEAFLRGARSGSGREYSERDLADARFRAKLSYYAENPRITFAPRPYGERYSDSYLASIRYRVATRAFVATRALASFFDTLRRGEVLEEL